MTEGDVLLAALPQSDGHLKRRPVICLREVSPFRDFLVCGVSSQLHQAAEEIAAGAGTEPAPVAK